MPRIARVVAVGYPHHITQRGNYRQKIFDYIEQEPKAWKELIDKTDNPDEIKGIREKTRTGQPLGRDVFIESLERQLKGLFKLMTKGRLKKKIDK